MSTLTNYGYVLVKPTEQEKKTESGLILGTDSGEEVKTGILLSAGMGTFQNGIRIPATLEGYVGHTVYYGRKSGIKIPDSKNPFENNLIMAVSEILAVDD